MGFRMRWPIEFNTITQRFGENPAFYARFKLPGHEGLDFGCKEGSKVFAVADGVVSRINLDGNSDPNMKPYGNQVRLQHTTSDGQFESIYAHLTDVVVGIGEHIRAGQLIAHSGSTGNSTGPHLHLTLKRKGATLAKLTNFINDIVDPFPFLDAFGTKYPDDTVEVEASGTSITIDLSTNRGSASGSSTSTSSTGLSGTSTPTQTASPTGTDMLRFLADVTIPDNTVIGAGKSFTKTWRIQNSGTNPWGTGYTLAFFQNERMGAPDSIILPTTAPGASAEVSVTFTAPTTPGTYRSVWKAKNPAGQGFGVVVFVVIKVQ